jgi:hypothetical protein
MTLSDSGAKTGIMKLNRIQGRVRVRIETGTCEILDIMPSQVLGDLELQSTKGVMGCGPHAPIGSPSVRDSAPRSRDVAPNGPTAQPQPSCPLTGI